MSNVEMLRVLFFVLLLSSLPLLVASLLRVWFCTQRCALTLRVSGIISRMLE
jgi:hypothetical protein